MASGDSLSVIVPSWREGPLLLDAVHAAKRAVGGSELVVVASEESRETAEAALAEGVTWVEAPRACRGLQLMLGVERARGELLAFLHADTRLPPDAGTLLRTALAADGVAGGAFRLRFDRAHPVLDALAWWSRMTLPTAFLGDQCLFCTRNAYEAAGGFRPEPLFEDVDLARRLRRVGRLVRLRQSVTTSARRFSRRGPYRQFTTNALLMLGYHLGVSPSRLHALYRGAAIAPGSVSGEP